jgi:hypothetical protein
MTTPEKDRQLGCEVARLKNAIVQHRARIQWVAGISLLAGVVVGLGAWFIQQPGGRDGIHFGFALGLFAATFFVGGLLGRLLLPKPDAACPQCGCDWNLESENDVQRLLAWHCCPGCGLKLSDDLATRAEP